jgi:hypothetical protein
MLESTQTHCLTVIWTTRISGSNFPFVSEASASSYVSDELQVAYDYEIKQNYVEKASLKEEHNAPNYPVDLVAFGNELLKKQAEGADWLKKHPARPTTAATTVATTAAAAEVEPEQPTLPNLAYTPYEGTLIGLVKARNDCRFEMIKIVREVWK